jgi:spore germination protein KC
LDHSESKRGAKKMKKLLLLLTILFIVTGCWDKKELEEQSYVIAIGLDKAKDEGDVKVTFQIANPEVGSSQTGGSSQEKPKETVTVTANDFLTAKNTLNAFVSREIILHHTRVIIVSEELARSKDFIRVIQSTVREREVRREVQIIVSKEEAGEFLRRNNPVMETRPHKYFQFVMNRVQEIGIVPNATIHRFFQITEGDAIEEEESNKKGEEDQYLAGQIEKKGGNKTQFMGAAVFKEGQMIGTLTGEETRLCALLDNTLEIRDMLVTYPDSYKKKYRIAARVVKKKDTDIKIDVKKSKTKIDVHVPVEIEILAIPSLVNYAEDIEKQEKLEQDIEKNLESKVKKFIVKTKEEFGGEPFYWSLYVRHNFLTIPQYMDYDWMNKGYPNADINVDFDVQITKFGQQIRDSRLNEVRD